MEKKYIIYKHTNKVNGKVYIGQTYQKPERRWQNGISTYQHNEHFLNAIKKYGWENFEHEILLSDLSQEEMQFWEDYYIEYYDARNPEKGYNKMKGGQVSPFQELWKDELFRQKMSEQQSFLMTERMKNPEEREKMRKFSQEYWNSDKSLESRKKLSDRMSKWLKEKWQDTEFQQKQSQQMKEQWKNFDLREKFIENSRKNALKNWQNSEYRKKMCKAVINIETGLYFESGAAAARWCGIDRSSITKALKNNKSAGKHPETKQPLHWRYAEGGGEL